MRSTSSFIPILLVSQTKAFSSLDIRSNIASAIPPIINNANLWGAPSATKNAFAFTSSIKSLKMSSILDYDVEEDLEEQKPFIITENGLSNTQLIINGVLLAAAFGFALYTMLTIDSDITRGWTQSEIVMRIPMDTWKGYEDSLSEKPIFTKTMINVIIYSLGDWLSQTIFQKRNVLDFDAKRTLRNGFIGLCFGPLVHLYYEFSDYILPVVGINRLYKIIMDQTVYLMTKCSLYILAVGLLAGEPLEECVNNVKTKIKPITFTAWKFWPLVHCVTYSVIPAQHRILWVNCVDLVWNAILATMAGRKGKDENNLTEALDESFESQFENLSSEFEALKNDTFTQTYELMSNFEIMNNTQSTIPYFIAVTNDTVLESVPVS